ncbi:MAG: sensor histidine kinase [Salibacteraceae bacterium]
MEPELKHHQKIATRNILLYAALSTFILSAVSYWGMGIHGNIPIIFLLFAIFNLVILYRFYIHENLIRVYFQGSALIFTAVMLINACSGGIDGVFNFFIPILVLSGYSLRKKYGRFWLFMSLFSLIAFYLFDGSFIHSMNEVNETSRPFFMFLSLITGTIITGAIYGEYLVELILHGKLKTAQLRSKNEENEILLKEIHHRVKNNMQVISGLLSLQSNFIKDDQTKEYFKLSQGRIKTMGIVHEMLYEESDFTSINFYEYLNRLVNQLINSMRGEEHQITLNLNISNVNLNLDTAIPLGIIINEIVTNSLKHGIPVNQPGTITLAVEKLNHPYFVLYASDNGKGMDKDFNINSSKTFGLNLINNLANQLKGDIEFEPLTKGTKYTLNFQEIIKRNLTESRG